MSLRVSIPFDFSDSVLTHVHQRLLNCDTSSRRSTIRLPMMIAIVIGTRPLLIVCSMGPPNKLPPSQDTQKRVPNRHELPIAIKTVT